MANLRTMATAAAVVLLAGVGGAASSQDAAAPGTPPSWDTLVKCAVMADEDTRLACYDAAMRAAGYAPKPAEVAAEKRHRFGLAMPEIRLLKRHAKQEGGQAVAANGAPAAAAAAKTEEDENSVSVVLDTVALVEPTHRLMLFTTDGAIWVQTDDEIVAPRPKAGQTILLQRNSFGGYFCKFDKRTKVRCERRH